MCNTVEWWPLSPSYDIVEVRDANNQYEIQHN